MRKTAKSCTRIQGKWSSRSTLSATMQKTWCGYLFLIELRFKHKLLENVRERRAWPTLINPNSTTEHRCPNSFFLKKNRRRWCASSPTTSSRRCASTRGARARFFFFFLVLSHLHPSLNAVWHVTVLSDGCPHTCLHTCLHTFLESISSYEPRTTYWS